MITRRVILDSWIDNLLVSEEGGGRETECVIRQLDAVGLNKGDFYKQSISAILFGYLNYLYQATKSLFIQFIYRAYLNNISHLKLKLSSPNLYSQCVLQA